MISLHCCSVRSVAINAYVSLGMSTCQKQNSSVAFVAFACAICVFHVELTSHRCFTSSLLLPLGANLTPSVLCASDGSSLGLGSNDYMLFLVFY